MKHLTAAEKRRALVSALTDSVTAIVERAVLDQVRTFLHGGAGEAPSARSATPPPRGRPPATRREAQKVAPPRAAQKVALPRTAQKIALPKAPPKVVLPRKAAPKAASPKPRLEASPEAQNAEPTTAMQMTTPPKTTPVASARLARTASSTHNADRPAPVERVQAPKATGDVGTAAERIFSHVQQNPGALGQEARIALGLGFADWRAGVAKLALDGKLRKEGNSLLPRYFVVVAPEPFKAVPPIRRKARVTTEQPASL